MAQMSKDPYETLDHTLTGESGKTKPFFTYPPFQGESANLIE